MEPYTVRYMGQEDITIVKWKVKPGSKVNRDTLLCSCQGSSSKRTYKLTSDCNGTVKKLVFKEGDVIHGGDTIALVELCTHPTVWRNMCAECGTYIKEREICSASVAMEHTIPDLLVSETEAQLLGREDETRLLKSRQLVLLVDLDQTLIHTTNDDIPNNLKDVYHFQLPHGRPQDLRWYHTKFRPRTEEFLENMSKLFELHICTFGVRSYAHTIARFLDPDGKYFQQRILSRDECFHPMLKTSNLKALFPCGDSMVCIIDDRQDVWKNAPNLVHVKPYRFFDGTADINAPPEADKAIPETTTSELGAGIGNVSLKYSQKQSKIVKICRKIKRKHAKKEIEVKGIEEKQVKDVETKQQEEESETGKENFQNKIECLECQNESSVTLLSDNMEIKDHLQSTADEVTSAASAATRLPVDSDNDLSKTPEKSSELEVSSQTETALGTMSELPSVPVKQGTVEEEEEIELIEWEDLDDYLIYLEDILQRIHSAFYEMYDEMKQNASAPPPDLKKIVPYVRKKVLRGANILFSGVFPTNQLPETAYAYQMAQALGATIHQNFVAPGTNGASKDSNATTHLVAAKLGTDKVRMVSKYKGVKIVNPDWLWMSADRWEWVDERLYPLNEETSKCFLLQGSPDPNTGQNPVTDSAGAKSTSDNSSTVTNVSDLETINLGMSSSAFKDMLKDVGDDLAESDDESEKEEGEDEGLKEEEKNHLESESESQVEEHVLRNKVLRKRKWDESSSEAESLSGDYPKGWKNAKGKRKQMKMDNSDSDNDDNDTNSSENLGDNEDDEEMENIVSKDGSQSDESFTSFDEMADILERDYLS